ncbi:uncharacterized protein LOC128888073 [Hylaeus anthracinus]|uniref:uncharacterized protein LOC128888073 n=1 Tax=Hylaeus anthracinus TaxID=313031 RepID=UPI0023B93D1E|nr:uncharacterized protein LOC128888073 [Hylaeus anthracinus]
MGIADYKTFDTKLGITMGDNVKIYQIHRFNGDNFHLLCRQMEIFMAENKLKPYILGTEVRTDQNATTWDVKDAEAQAFIMRGLELEQLKHLSDCNTAAKMWSRLKTVHSEKRDQSIQALLHKFFNCKMEDCEKVADFIAKIVSFAQRLKDMEMKQKTPVIITKILTSLPPKFDNVRTSWYAVARENQTIERLTDHLVNEEAILNLRTTTGEDTPIGAAFVSTRGEHLRTPSSQSTKIH